jgi:hypothetical protein
MELRLMSLVDSTKIKFGLENYYLKRYELYRKVNIFNETIYTFCMEWFPNHHGKHEDEDYNPEGTAVIEIDVNSGRYNSVIFVGGISFAKGNIFTSLEKNSLIKWIEDETGLVYGEQFQLSNEEVGELYFKECIDGIDVSPSGSIDLRFDEGGKLTFFSVNGHFPSNEMVREETYSLSLEMIEQLVKEQLKLIEIPVEEEKNLISVFAIEEIFIMNDQKSTIPFEFIVDEKSYLKINKVIQWDKPNNKPFKRKEISLTENVTAEQAFSNEPHPDSFPITCIEKEKCVDAVGNFLSQVYPNDSAKWVLKTLHRNNGSIYATLKLNNQDRCVFQRKLLIMIDRNFKAFNYLDNKIFIDIFNQYQVNEDISIHKEEAYEKIRGLIELTVYYVYDVKQKQYILCGKLDSRYCVNTNTGEVNLLSDYF